MKLLLNCFLVLVLFINIACKEEQLPSPSNGPNPDYDSINQDVISNNNTSDHSEPHSDPHCTNDNDDNSPVDDLLGNVDQLMCSKKCEKNYTALKKIDEIDPYGHFAFANTGWADGIGRCRGMTIMQQQYNMLADFNKGPNPHNCGRGKPMTAQCKNFYKSLIADIQSNKVAEIPGFKGLNEFSRDPYIQTLLRKKAYTYSHRYTANTPTITQRTGNRTIDQWNEVKRRIGKRQLPFLAVRGVKSTFFSRRPLNDHAVMPYRMDKVDGKEVMCIRDPNIQPAGPGGKDICKNYMYLSGSSIYFKRRNQKAFKLEKFNIWRDDEERTKDYVKARYDHCIKSKREGAECV
jgi:hypothetical protein